ncbi:phosphate/phosphite/phosphonate ABC transporter substrate-binding protein [Sandarakinorhabdus sp.]|uniref:phosphate/phosphite/phosphonate ABC transporter substrate-binding protein n=1 Tax=Sandarakinorhabdus sp. TaxID=1916663 RepID=UPI003F6F976A
MGDWPVLMRSIALAALLVLAACGGNNANPDASGWRKEVSEVRIGANLGEENPTALARLDAYRDYIAKSTGLPVKVFKAADYNGIIQALASGQLEMASMGPAAYANAHAQIGDKVTPVLANRSAEGLSGYYSTLIVRADSPYRTIDDLRGKTIGYVDFNSASGYVYPRWALKKQGVDPDTFFGKSAISGGHIQGVLALENGQFDGVFLVSGAGAPRTGFTNSTLYAMAARGLVKAEDFRIIWFAGPIANSPHVIRTDRPQPLKDILRGALAAMPYDDPELWADIGLSNGSDMQPMQASDYAEVIAIRNAEVQSRRAGGSAGN